MRKISQFKILLASVTLVVATTSCRIARVGNSEPSPESGKDGGGDATASAPIIQPQRQSSGIVQAMPISFDASHLVSEQLNLRLDYFATPKSGGISTATCYDEIAGHLVVGRAVCGANESLTVDIRANQINQICYTQSLSPKVPAKDVVKLIGCVGPATLQIYKFSPEVKVEAVK